MKRERDTHTVRERKRENREMEKSGADKEILEENLGIEERERERENEENRNFSEKTLFTLAWSFMKETRPKGDLRSSLLWFNVSEVKYWQLLPSVPVVLSRFYFVPYRFNLNN